MTQYECENVRQVRAKVYELTGVKPPVKTPEEKAEESAYWRGICRKIKRDAIRGVSTWDSISDVPALDESGEEIEVCVCIGYDTDNGVHLVWIEGN